MSPAAHGAFLGWQSRPGGRRPVALFALDHAIPGHPMGSGLSAATIREAGYTLPAVPCLHAGCLAPAAWVGYFLGPGEPAELEGAAWCEEHARPLRPLGVLVALTEALAV